MKLTEVVKTEIVKPATIKELIDSYKRFGTYKDLAYKSQKDYDYYLQSVVNSPYASKPIDHMTPVLCNALYESIKKTNGIVSANQMIAVLRIVYSYAQGKEWIASNPFSFVNREIPPARDVLWSTDRIEAVIAEAVNQGKDYIAKGIWLMYDTAQRPGDILRLTFADVRKDDNGWYLEFRQHKTGTKVAPTVSHECADFVGFGDVCPPETRLVGRSCSVDIFRAEFRLIANSLGISPNLQLRDIRRTAITEAGENATDDQMKAMSGHKNRDMLDTYSVSSRKKALAAFKARSVKSE